MGEGEGHGNICKKGSTWRHYTEGHGGLMAALWRRWSRGGEEPAACVGLRSGASVGKSRIELLWRIIRGKWWVGKKCWRTNCTQRKRIEHDGGSNYNTPVVMFLLIQRVWLF